jgi:hypothetical protein
MRFLKNYDTFGYGQCRTPLIAQNVQAYATVRVDVWVVNASGEVHLWRFEGIIGGKVNCQEEYTARVGTVTLVILSVVSPSWS